MYILFHYTGVCDAHFPDFPKTFWVYSCFPNFSQPEYGYFQYMEQISVCHFKVKTARPNEILIDQSPWELHESADQDYKLQMANNIVSDPKYSE